MYKVVLKANKDLYVWEFISYSDIGNLVEEYKSGIFDVYESERVYTEESNKEYWKYLMTISK